LRLRRLRPPARDSFEAVRHIAHGSTSAIGHLLRWRTGRL
jgi:hypothetical protein